MAAALPDFVIVGGVGYRVKQTDDLHYENEDGSTRKLVGYIQYADCLIQIDSKSQEQAKVICLFHEVGHALLYQAGLDSGNDTESFEKIAQMLGYGIYALLRSNRGWSGWRRWRKCRQFPHPLTPSPPSREGE